MKGLGIITRKYIGKSFSECNCLQLLHYIYKDLGIDFPKEFKGYTLITYMDYWRKKPRVAEQDLIALFEFIGHGIDVGFQKRGDALILKHKHSIFPCLYLVNNMALSSSETEGVITIPLGKNYQPILVRRLT